ncbi:hypothetical protein Tco_0362984 [Tanacetum coccineum]
MITLRTHNEDGNPSRAIIKQALGRTGGLHKDGDADASFHFRNSDKYYHDPEECERVEDLQLGVESYQKKLNLTKPDTFRPDLKKRTACTTYSDPQGVIYTDQNKRNRLMLTVELHKFSDGTLNHVRTALHDITSGIRIEYLSKKKWSILNKRRARVMI